jgi:hypothetical protein
MEDGMAHTIECSNGTMQGALDGTRTRVAELEGRLDETHQAYLEASPPAKEYIHAHG